MPNRRRNNKRNNYRRNNYHNSRYYHKNNRYNNWDEVNNNWHQNNYQWPNNFHNFYRGNGFIQYPGNLNIPPYNLPNHYHRFYNPYETNNHHDMGNNLYNNSIHNPHHNWINNRLNSEEHKWRENPTWFRNFIKSPKVFHPVSPPPPPPPPPNNTNGSLTKNNLQNNFTDPIKRNISIQTGNINKNFTWDPFGKNSSKNLDGELKNIFKPSKNSFDGAFQKASESIKDSLSNEINSDENEKEELEFQILEEKIENISDLIELGNLYNTKYKDVKKNFSLDLKILNDMVNPLTELNNLIGLNNVKKQLFDQIIFYLQSLDNKNFDMLHTVIAGSPGTGKTELAKIIAKIYNKMGILSKGTFQSVKRNDLIGGYLGQTAIKTQKALESAKGGVLFIDEAYSLGNKEGRDSYSKECIDTITAFLTEEKEDFICIIAGYKSDLEKCFFSVNSGLKRRFNWKFDIGKYSPSELRSIFIKKIKDYDWKIKSEEDIDIDLFESNKDLFEFNGGDMETLFQKCKMAHSIRVLKSHPSEKKSINKDDLTKGLEIFKDSKDAKNDKFYQLMYC